MLHAHPMSCMTLSWRPSDVIVSTSFINSSICCLLTPLLPVSYSTPRAPPATGFVSTFGFVFIRSVCFWRSVQDSPVRSVNEEPFADCWFEILPAGCPSCHPTNSVNTMMTLLFEVTSCAGGRHNMPPPLWPWPLTFWPWKWCPNHVWRGLPLCQF